MNHNYFFVDGSALLSDVRSIRTSKKLGNRRFKILGLVSYFAGVELQKYHENEYRRFVFYFAKGDSRLKDDLILPDESAPDAKSDMRIEECGKRVSALARASEWLGKHGAPEYVRDCLYRSEKAVDTQICCDALQLVARNKLDRLFLYSNDFDFVPLCRCLRSLGVNINLIRLHVGRVNKALAKECDAYSVMPIETIMGCFEEAGAQE